MDKKIKIYIAGHRGLVGSAIKREFEKLFNVGVALLFFLFLMFIFANLCFVVHKDINLFCIVAALFTSCFSLYYFSRESNLNKKDIIYSYLLFFTVILSSYFLAISKIDYSWDGRAYHQIGIILLGNGYNPIYDSVYTFAENLFNNSSDSNLIWVETYPKVMEILSANIFLITKQIESGKMISYILMFICFSYSLKVLNKNLFLNVPISIKILLSLLIVFNPVVISQMFTYYTDIGLYLFFVLMFIAMIELAIEENNKALFIYFISAISLLNVKWGGVLFYLVTTILYLLYLLINKKNKFILKFIIINLFVIVLTALTLINPIYTNIKNYNNPLYPIYGQNKIDIMTPTSPKEFINQNRFKNLFISTFCEVNNIYNVVQGDNYLKLKVPFSIKRSELYNFKGYDTRACGFGVFWSGIVLLTLILSFCIKFNNQKEKRVALLIFALLILLTVLNPYSWWARYAPHIWLFSIFVAIFTLNKKFKNRFDIVISCLLIIFILANIIIQVIYVSKAERRYRRGTEAFLSQISQNFSNDILKIYGDFQISTIQKLKENNLIYKFVTEDYYLQYKENFYVIPFGLGDNLKYELEEK